MKKEHKNHRSLTLVAGMSSLLMLPMQGFYLSIFAPNAIAQQQTAELSPQQLQKLSQSITVKVISGDKGGSGILIRKQGSLYTVLTSKHVLQTGKPHQILTADSQKHQGEIVKGVNFGNQDLVLLQFSTKNNYAVASIGNSTALKEGDEVFAAGFPFEDNASEKRQFVFRTGRVSILLDKKLQGGYQVGYTNEVEKGMSGGPVLNIQGQLVGINGIQAQPLWENPYVYEDGTQPNDTLRQRMKSSSWAVPIQLLVKLAPQFVPAEIAQQSQTEVKIATAPAPQLTNQVDSIAKEITVLISWSTGNGSGAIVAKEGDTYYVLTAKHVASGDRQLKVFTPDGQEHAVDISKIKTWDGIDIALVQFTSKQTYQVAKLANYGLDVFEDQVIFVSGFPESNQVNVKSSRQFSAGFLLNWIIVANSARDDRSFSSGYELVYSNITARGMSGGPLLDIEGRLIGIHAAAEATEGKKPSPIPEKRPGNAKLELGYSLGVPIRTLLVKLQQDNIKLNLTQTNSPPKQLTVSEQDEIVTASLNLKQPEKSSDAIEWLNFGNKLWRLRRYEQSEQAFEKAIKLKPDFYEAWYAYGMALVRQEKYKQAITSFKTAVKYNQNSDQAWRQLGDAFWYSGEYEQALKAFEQAIVLRPDDFILYNWKADALNQLGRYPEALKTSNESIRINPKHSESYFRRGITRANYLQDYSEGINDINKALELQPDLAIGYQYRGTYRSLQQDYTGALDDLKRAIDLKPKLFGAYADRGLVYARMGNRQKFDENFKHALRLKPDDANIYITRGYAYSLLGETQKAIDDYTAAIRLSPQFAHDFYTQRGLVHSAKQDYTGAIKDYTEALRFRANYVPAYIYRGYAYAKLGKRQESIQDFDKALSLQPDNAWVYSNRGYARFILKDYQQGIEDYNQAIKLAPDLAHLFYAERASSRIAQEDYKGAIEDYSQAIKLKPDNAIFYSSRASSRIAQEDYKGAIEDYSQAIKLKPDNAIFYSSRASSRNAQEDYKGAIEDYSQAIKLEPDNAIFYISRGLANAQLNNKQKVIEDLQKAAQIFRDGNDMESYKLTQDKIRELQQ